MAEKLRTEFHQTRYVYRDEIELRIQKKNVTDN